MRCCVHSTCFVRAVPLFALCCVYGALFIHLSIHLHSMFGSCATPNPNCFSWTLRTATTEARLKADLAASLKTAAIAKMHGWNKVSVQRAIRKVRSGASLLTKAKRSKITQTASNYIKEMSEKDKSLAEIRRGTTTDFGVTLSRSTISRHLRTTLKKNQSRRCVRFACARSTRGNAGPFASNFFHV